MKKRLNHNFCVGDKVMYIQHDHISTHATFDRKIFSMNKVYIIDKVVDDKSGVYVQGKQRALHNYQVARGIKDTKIARKMNKNRILESEIEGYIFIKPEEEGENN